MLEKDTIYIYNDRGAGEEAVKQSQHMVTENVGDKYNIQFINAKSVKEGLWIKNAALFILPGGADLPYCKKLRGVGNERIREYVEKGGSFLGICAGAYYASSGIEFAKGHPRFEVIGKRELAFYPGIVVGPTFSEYDYASARGSRAEKLIWKEGDNVATYIVYYQGGGHFMDPEKFPGIKILGFYSGEAKELPAIIEFSVGKGKVVLSGVHPEFDPSLMNKEDEFLHPIIPILQEGNQERKILCRKILNKLLR